jgi:hypothetical protein
VISPTGTDRSCCSGKDVAVHATRTIALTDEEDLTGWTPTRALSLLNRTDTWALRNGAACGYPIG